jgi:predicted Fe-Mo cluster-binding NifX family protein
MRIGVPTGGHRGLDEDVFGQFGCAPHYTIVDTDDDSVRIIRGSRYCHPFELLEDEALDAVVVQDIGMHAMARIAELGVLIFEAPRGTVADAVAALRAGRLRLIGAGRATIRSPSA